MQEFVLLDRQSLGERSCSLNVLITPATSQQNVFHWQNVKLWEATKNSINKQQPCVIFRNVATFANLKMFSKWVNLCQQGLTCPVIEKQTQTTHPASTTTQNIARQLIPSYWSNSKNASLLSGPFHGQSLLLTPAYCNIHLSGSYSMKSFD